MSKTWSKYALFIGIIAIAIIFQTRFRVFTKLIKGIFYYERTISYDTPSTVKSVKQIDELITAEFCGESYCSLGELRESDIRSEWIIVEKELRWLFEEVKKALLGLELLDFNKNERSNYFLNSKNYYFLTNNELFHSLVNLSNKRSKSNKLDEIRSISWELFQGDKFERYKSEFIDEKLDDSDLLYISRGCIQAGIDFSDAISGMQESLADSILILKNISIKILSANVNPWFVPKKISGFEVWEKTNAKHLSFQEISEVKEECIENLRVEAISNGIRKKAIDNAMSVVNRIVNSLNPKIKKVVIVYPYVDYYVEKVLIDSTINRFELLNLTRDVEQTIHNGQMSVESYTTMDKDFVEICNSLLAFCTKNKMCSERSVTEILQLKENLTVSIDEN